MIQKVAHEDGDHAMSLLAVDFFATISWIFNYPVHSKDGFSTFCVPPWLNALLDNENERCIVMSISDGPNKI